METPAKPSPPPGRIVSDGAKGWRGWLCTILFVASAVAWAWQHERWHELNAEMKALSAKAEAYIELCRAVRPQK